VSLSSSCHSAHALQGAEISPVS